MLCFFLLHISIFICHDKWQRHQSRKQDKQKDKQVILFSISGTIAQQQAIGMDTLTHLFPILGRWFFFRKIFHLLPEEIIEFVIQLVVIHVHTFCASGECIICFNFCRALARFEREVLSLMCSFSEISWCEYPSMAYRLKTMR